NSGSATMTTAGSGFDTVLAVYSGSSVGSLGTAIASNDDIPDVPGQPHNVTSSVIFSATAGTTYRIAVDGFDNGDGGGTGNLVLNWSETNCTQSPPTVRLTATDYPIAENSGPGFVTVSVIREGDASSAASVNFATSDTSSLNAACSQVSGKASDRCDYATSLGTLSWAAGESGTKSFNIPIINDALVEGNETFNVTLSSPTGVSLGATTTATVTIQDNDSSPSSSNPIDGVDFFITQQYIDILGRMPDAGGFQNWHDTLAPCPNGGFGEPPTSNCDRLHVAAGFFQSAEFLNRGYFAFRFYMVAFNQRPTYAQFMPDMAQVGGPKSPAEEEAAKVAYANAFVVRPAFTSQYPGLSGQALANALLQKAGLPAGSYNAGGQSNGQILRGIAESQGALDKFLTEGTVSIQYFAFLRRDPDTTGYNNNVATLNANPSNLRHMIFIFIYSTEYRGRFGTP
ncbi:MAG: Calx-beta domain-containing protein, partial [Acidobacteriota bacterium]